MYVKQLELSHFKSFGSTTAIPLLPGFTVVSGPNGSGKSNLLDALLFALGLAGSRGMRAERLPDLVNHAQIKRGHAISETRVTVTFELSPQELEELAAAEAAEAEEAERHTDTSTVSVIPKPDTETNLAPNEWQVTRKLRVTKQGTYTSSYAINGESCTLTQLHEQLNRRRIYPEGYNVVLQGDVTSIISMNARQRREIIDELAGVANFDRRINQAKDKLDAVKEQEERSRIVEQELNDQCERLARDRIKAEKYQKLRTELQSKAAWEGVLAWRDLQAQIDKKQKQLATEQQTQAKLEIEATTLATELEEISQKLETLNAQVKALGEEEHLALQAQIATQEAELKQLQRQQGELEQSQEQIAQSIQNTQQQLQTLQAEIQQVGEQRQTLETTEIPRLTQARNQAQEALDTTRQQAQAIAQSADAWIEQQSHLNQQIKTVLQALEPQRAEQAQLQERVQQLDRQSDLQQQSVEQIAQEVTETQVQLETAEAEVLQRQEQVQDCAGAIAEIDHDINTQQETQNRLLREQQEKQRQLDKLEAQEQAQQEVQGTHATHIIRKAKLAGVHGLVAQLGQVDSHYQTALEVAAGGRLGCLVVDDDAVASAGIELLKRERGGRATFLPLNKMRPPKGLPSLTASGAIDFAIELIDFDPIYEPIFAYVFGNTVVFKTLSDARRHIGKYRMVTLDGELLEPTGAMTGGSRNRHNTLHFGTGEAGESAAIMALKQRLSEIATLLQPIENKIEQTQAKLASKHQELSGLRQQHREAQLKTEQLQKELKVLADRQAHLEKQRQTYGSDLKGAQDRLQTLQTDLPQQETELEQLREALEELEQSQTHGEWKTLQNQIQGQESIVAGREQALREVQQHIQELTSQQERLQEKQEQAEVTLQTLQTQTETQATQKAENQDQQQQIEATIATLRTELAKLEERLGSEKQERDRVEKHLQERTAAHQQLLWQIQKTQDKQQEHQDLIQQLQTQLQAKATELPDPLPEIPEDLTLEQLREELQKLQKRLQAMEPVNMLAIEEYERTQERLVELTEKLTTLESERTELLLRIENFRTLRYQSFREAYDAIDVNFQSIFAELSDGDGHLQLDNPEDPFQGGLNLVAHPKGKPVQRLASMSGGEKSLTALSFIFALQRYRPSPFYAFDEVDMFLDGANVERLSKMIQKQAKQAQFIVVSLRRPMIEASDRTIGVTQARGTHTQVIGMQLRPTVTEPATPVEAS
ncbi:chromosome segregation protein SMC [Acaryochloris marina]|uniref:Chromosome partition protein Smc n=1 Tax=Acaryochloris marina (strain MBIC 11017) TaxID=329726 RepID=B0C9C4_ACAM1|nr:chromosome segregation protein SMC [Acaryochloris marina]ABW27805.1 chromosome segregation protein SMC [Acaryochloris marina MBIC11017]BDM82533.1 chromosome partition protein Smc [Acaryochloris marina MBIC10699]